MNRVHLELTLMLHAMQADKFQLFFSIPKENERKKNTGKERRLFKNGFSYKNSKEKFTISQEW